jgi:arsenical pump membrane protein
MMQALSASQTVLVWSIAGGTLAGVLFRPKQWPEAVWACLGALLLVICGLLPVHAALGAVAKGTDVYLFLAGMMLLAELARREGVFDWLAGLAIRFSRESRARLFALIYGVGILVTVFLSNDATAVVLTPAVYAAVKKARADALTYLFICAFIANAASFVLPISNPANLVVYGKTLPPLVPWLRTFFVPSICSIAATFVTLRWIVSNELRGKIEDGKDAPALTANGQRAAWGIVGSGAVLMAASALGLDLGLPTFVAALVAVLIATRLRGRAIRKTAAGVAWSVLPLVAGLFVLVEALNRAGALAAITNLLGTLAGASHMGGALAASFGIAGLSNLMNNLPSGLLAGSAIQAAHVTPRIRDAVLIGVDLGPNLSVTGSLATVLWLIALRREGVHITAWRFLKVGAMVMPPALFLATISAAWLSR